MFRRYRLYSTRRDGRLTTDRRKWRMADNNRRSVWIVRASSMRQAKRVIEEEQWAEGPRSPGIIRRILGWHHGDWEVADYLDRGD